MANDGCVHAHPRRPGAEAPRRPACPASSGSACCCGRQAGDESHCPGRQLSPAFSSINDRFISSSVARSCRRQGCLSGCVGHLQCQHVAVGGGAMPRASSISDCLMAGVSVSHRDRHARRRRRRWRTGPPADLHRGGGSCRPRLIAAGGPSATVPCLSKWEEAGLVLEPLLSSTGQAMILAGHVAAGCWGGYHLAVLQVAPLNPCDIQIVICAPPPLLHEPVS